VCNLRFRQQLTFKPAILDRAETLLSRLPLNAAVVDRMQGEVETWRSMVHYLSGNTARSVTAARRALEKIPAEWWMLRAQARLFLSACYQMAGELGPAYANLYDSGEPDQGGALRKRLLMNACFVHWLAADLSSVAQAATQVLDGSDQAGLQMETSTWAHYYLGLVHYQRNELAEASGGSPRCLTAFPISCAVLSQQCGRIGPHLSGSGSAGQSP
jgi:ATP/maltotriose-dependent transcriptional regulator MalT